MKNRNKKATLLLLIVLIITAFVHLQAAIPVRDTRAILKLIRDMHEIIARFKSEVLVYQDIISTKDEYIRSMREILYRAETLFNAVTYFPKTVPGQYELNPFFYDRLGKDTWRDLYHKDGRIDSRYPDLNDFSYILKNPLYKTRKEFREYADRLIEILKEENTEVQNEFDLVKMIREFEQQQAKLFDEFEHVIVPAFGTKDEIPDEEKVVDVTRLYFAIGRAKIEVLKQKLELLLMEKEIMENYLKAEVRQVQARLLYYRYHKLYRK